MSLTTTAFTIHDDSPDGSRVGRDSLLQGPGGALTHEQRCDIVAKQRQRYTAYDKNIHKNERRVPVIASAQRTTATLLSQSLSLTTTRSSLECYTQPIVLGLSCRVDIACCKAKETFTNKRRQATKMTSKARHQLECSQQRSVLQNTQHKRHYKCTW